jgi:hypothetical protein
MSESRLMFRGIADKAKRKLREVWRNCLGLKPERASEPPSDHRRIRPLRVVR